MTTSTRSPASLALKVAFMLATAWAVLVAFVQWMDTVLETNPVAEGGPFHGFFEIVVLLAVPSAAGFTSMVACRRWPMFLQVHRDVSLVSVLWRLLAVAPVVFAVTGLVFFAVTWLFVVRAGAPADPQYGLSAWWAGYYYALMLTPVITVTGVWLWLRRGYRE